MTPRERLDMDRLSTLRARLAEPALAAKSDEVDAEVFQCFFADQVYVEDSRFLYRYEGLAEIDGELLPILMDACKIPRYTACFDDAFVLKGQFLSETLSLTEVEDDFLPIWEAKIHDRGDSRVVGTGRSTECAVAILLSVLDSIISNNAH